MGNDSDWEIMMSKKANPKTPLSGILLSAIRITLKGQFEHVEHLAEGSTAIVFKVRQTDMTHIERAVKVIRPSLFKEELYFTLYRDEVSKMAMLTHQNVVQIVSTGELAVGREKTGYIVMECLADPSDLEPYVESLNDRLTNSKVIDLFKQSVAGLEYLHNNKVIHMDLKSENIFVDKNGNLKIGDFGFAIEIPDSPEQHIKIGGTILNWPEKLKKAAQKGGAKGSKEGRMVAEVPGTAIGPRIDFHMLSLIFGRIVKDYGARFSSEVRSYLSLMCQRMNIDDPQEPKYVSAAQIYADLLKLEKHYSPDAEVGEISAAIRLGVVRVPELEGIPISARVEALIDHPWVQRLKKAKQTGLCHFVYPGAMHTRFEHSLGVYYKTIKYVTALMADKRTPYFMQAVSERDLSVLLAAALLHDLGHHTYAHSFEDEAGDIGDPHEVDTARIISGSEATGEIFGALLPGQVSIADLLHKRWGFEEPDMALLTYLISKEGELAVPATPVYAPILKSIIDGPIDADKMDYLVRDSIHCGVLYGRFLDEGRFFQSLTVRNEGARDKWGIAVTEKGRICAELFLICRSNMFSEVYWHHAVRSFSAMVNRALLEHMEEMVHRDQEINQLSKAVFAGSEDDVMNLIARGNSSAAKNIIELVRKRQNYKRIYVVDHRENAAQYSFLAQLKSSKRRINEQEAREARAKYERFMKHLTAELNKLLGKDYPDYYYLLDVPQQGRHKLGEFAIYREGVGAPEDFFAVSQLWNDPKEHWERWTRKIRLFLHPVAYEDCFCAKARERYALKADIGKIINEYISTDRYRGPLSLAN
jgi:HD superfamily phosphohydrolase/tRNA A-37 threonylcarbamoyl transferase component Bud32